MLLEDRVLESVWLMTPHGIGLNLSLCEINRGKDFVSCGIVKDSGDDPDVTNGITVYAKVTKTDKPQTIEIDGGEGIGRVTKPGLDQPVGNAAINSTPRKMIEDSLREVCKDNEYPGGLSVVISAPKGVELAKRTFNPRLGIEGGISVLGTTGIVEPMSDEAVVETIKTELSMRKATGKKNILFTPGNYGSDFVRDTLRISPETAVITSNFIGDAFDLAKDFDGALLVAHIGKMIKLAAGVFNTHSKYGDGRAETFAEHAELCGADSSLISRIKDCAMTDDMIRILDEAGLKDAVMASIMKSIDKNLKERVPDIRTGAVTFSNVYGLLGKTENADELLEKIREENS